MLLVLKKTVSMTAQHILQVDTTLFIRDNYSYYYYIAISATANLP